MLPRTPQKRTLNSGWTNCGPCIALCNYIVRIREKATLTLARGSNAPLVEKF
jgi:hypothetical protein